VIWKEREEADLLAFKQLKTSKIDKSLIAIQAFLNQGPAHVSVSWGKDSVVMAYLVRTVDPSVPILNFRCRNRNPDCEAVRDSFLVKFPSNYKEVEVDYQDLHAKDLSDDDLNRLTDSRWFSAIKEASRPFQGRHITGVRADESRSRRIRCLRWGHNSRNGCAPLAWWTQQEVFSFLAAKELPVHPSYAMVGGGRYPREAIRVAEIGDSKGVAVGRREWEREYYGDILNRLAANR
jgi:phosphoadenosine phosphosulfate reductase